MALKPYGVPKAEALSAALVIHALNTPYLVAGIVCLRVEAAGRRYAPDEAAEALYPGETVGSSGRPAATGSEWPFARRRYAQRGAAEAGASAGLQNQ